MYTYIYIYIYTYVGQGAIRFGRNNLGKQSMSIRISSNFTCFTWGSSVRHQSGDFDPEKHGPGPWSSGKSEGPPEAKTSLDSGIATLALKLYVFAAGCLTHVEHDQ